MPVFFIVGGFSNSASWSSALRDGRGYSTWLSARMQRLLGPLMPLLFVWVVLGVVAHLFDVSPAMVKIGSQAALVPVWFLAVYVLVVLLVPVTHAAWSRLGLGSFWILVAGAVLIDALGVGMGLEAIRWVNYLFVWLAVHQLGYAWRDDRFSGAGKSLVMSMGGLLVLLGLLVFAGYPRSMVGVPTDEFSNTLPPTLAMLALGCFQGGFLLSLEGPVRRWLSHVRPWAATVMVNGMIMTVYLWHLTVMVLVIGLAVVLGGTGIRLTPGTTMWWGTRPLWMIMLAVLLIPFVMVFGRLERGSGTAPNVSGWRLVIGSIMVGGGLALIALGGIGADGPLGIRWGVVLLAFVGAGLAGVRPVPRRA
jgi:hypothetical protein